MHQLFSGYAARSNTLDDYAEHSVLMWAEANKDLVCNSLEDMASLQEAAVFSDVLMNGGENQLGLETFARTAANAANPNTRYDFAKYRNPWAVRKETPAVVAIRKGWKRQAPWTERQRDRPRYSSSAATCPWPRKGEREQSPRAPQRAPRSAGQHRKRNDQAFLANVKWRPSRYVRKTKTRLAPRASPRGTFALGKGSTVDIPHSLCRCQASTMTMMEAFWCARWQT